MFEVVEKKLKNGRTQVTQYYSPRSFWDVLTGKGKIKETYTLNKCGKEDGEHLFFGTNGKLSSKVILKNGEWVCTEKYENGKIFYKDFPKGNGSFLILREYYRLDGSLESKCSFHYVGGKKMEFMGPFENYDKHGNITDKGIHWPVGYKNYTIRDEKKLTEFLSDPVNKRNKERILKAYKEAFSKVNSKKGHLVKGKKTKERDE